MSLWKLADVVYFLCEIHDLTKSSDLYRQQNRCRRSTRCSRLPEEKQSSTNFESSRCDMTYNECYSCQRRDLGPMVHLCSRKVWSKTKHCRSLIYKVWQRCQHLILSCAVNNIGPEGAMSIAGAVKRHPSLQKLSVSGNEMSTDGARFFAEVLDVNRVITTLDMSSMKMYRCSLELTINRKCHWARRNPVTRNCIKRQLSFTRVAHSLYQRFLIYWCHTIVGNNFGSDGATAIATACKANTTLHSLNLQGIFRSWTHS